MPHIKAAAIINKRVKNCVTSAHNLHLFFACDLQIFITNLTPNVIWIVSACGNFLIRFECYCTSETKSDHQKRESTLALYKYLRFFFGIERFLTRNIFLSQSFACVRYCLGHYGPSCQISGTLFFRMHVFDKSAFTRSRKDASPVRFWHRLK
jgi:hypothetical protein